MSSIRLHPEFGVNPSLDMCFWCEEPVGVALMGLNKGKEAPRHVITSYTPCEKCQANMALGITLVEVASRTAYPDRPQIQEGIVPTGRWMVIKEEAAANLFNEATVAQVLKVRKAFIEAGALYDSLLPPPEKVADEDEAGGP